MKQLLILTIVLMALAGYLLLPTQVVQANSAAPMFIFELKFQGPPIPILNADLLSCDDKMCAKTTLGVTHLKCSARQCEGLYDNRAFHKLIIKFADRTLESNIFQTDGKHKFFSVVITDTSLVVEEAYLVKLLPLGGFFILVFFMALVTTLISETVVASLYCYFFLKSNLALIAWTPIMNVITVPIVWFFFLRLPLDGRLSLFSGEVFAIVAEAGFIYWRKIPYRQALTMSLLINIASYLLGYMLLFG